MVKETPVWTRDPKFWSLSVAEHALIGEYELAAFVLPANAFHPRDIVWEVFTGPKPRVRVANGSAISFDEAKRAAEEALQRLAPTSHTPITPAAELISLFGDQIGRLIRGGPDSWTDGLGALARLAVGGHPLTAQETLRAIVDATLLEAYGITAAQRVLEENEELLGDPWHYDSDSKTISICPNCDRQVFPVMVDRRSAAWSCDDCGWESDCWIRS